MRALITKLFPDETHPWKESFTSFIDEHLGETALQGETSDAILSSIIRHQTAEFGINIKTAFVGSGFLAKQVSGCCRRLRNRESPDSRRSRSPATGICLEFPAQRYELTIHISFANPPLGPVFRAATCLLPEFPSGCGAFRHIGCPYVYETWDTTRVSHGRGSGLRMGYSTRMRLSANCLTFGVLPLVSMLKPSCAAGRWG